MIFINDLNLEVSEEFLFLYLKCLGVYRELARRIFLRQAALGARPQGEVRIPHEHVQQAFDLFRMDNNLLSREELDSLLDVFGLRLDEIKDYLEARCQVERILTEKIRRGEFSDRSIKLELLFDERCRRLVVQASTWEIVARRVSQVSDEDRARFEKKARDRLLAISDIGEWDTYCGDLGEMGVDENAIQQMITVLANVEAAKSQEAGRAKPPVSAEASHL